MRKFGDVIILEEERAKMIKAVVKLIHCMIEHFTEDEKSFVAETCFPDIIKKEKKKKEMSELPKANIAVSEIVDMAEKLMKEGMSRDMVEFIIRAALHHVELGLGEEN